MTNFLITLNKSDPINRKADFELQEIIVDNKISPRQNNMLKTTTQPTKAIRKISPLLLNRSTTTDIKLNETRVPIHKTTDENPIFSFQNF